MPEALLTERDILNRTGWPTVKVIAKRMRSQGFPKPHMTTPDMGPQWREEEFEAWVTGGGSIIRANRLRDRFAPR